MKRRAVYHVRYRILGKDVSGIDVIASSKFEAYDIATYDMIPKSEGETPYSSWVESVTYNNGKYHRFNTCEGNAY